VQVRTYDYENYLWVQQMPKVRTSKLLLTLQPISPGRCGAGGCTKCGRAPQWPARPPQYEGCLALCTAGSIILGCIHSQVGLHSKLPSWRRNPFSLQELRAPLFALRAFNVETALIGEHAKGEMLVLMRCQVCGQAGAGLCRSQVDAPSGRVAAAAAAEVRETAAVHA